MSLLLRCRNITKGYGDLTVLNSIQLQINTRDRIGLVGANGAGKTTLASIISGELECDAGFIEYTRAPEISYLHQQVNLNAVLRAVRDAKSTDGTFLQSAGKLGIHDLIIRAEHTPSVMSGGEKSKLALAWAWNDSADLLILDEPTNHMDVTGVRWLLQALDQYLGAVLIISHDRHLLDQSVSRIAEIENGCLRMYEGNYSAYRETKRKQFDDQLHLYEAQQKNQQRIEAAIDQLKSWSARAHNQSRRKALENDMRKGGKEYYRAKAKKRDQAVKSQINRLEKLKTEGVPMPSTEPQIHFQLQNGAKHGRRFLEADDISKSFGSHLLFQKSSFYVNRGEIVGLFGPNGCGKTTLLKILMGEAQLDSGSVFISPSAQIIYIDQGDHETRTESVLDLLRMEPRDRASLAITRLVQLGLPFDRLQQPMTCLSPGERVKIKTSLAMMNENNLLLFDEPTNHMDIYSRESLETCLTQYPGTVLLVSHDQYLLKNVCRQLLVFNNNTITRQENGLSLFANEDSDWIADHSPTANSYTDNRSRELLLETKMACLADEMNKLRTDQPSYAALEKEYFDLARERRRLKELQ